MLSKPSLFSCRYLEWSLNPYSPPSVSLARLLAPPHQRGPPSAAPVAGWAATGTGRHHAEVRRATPRVEAPGRNCVSCRCRRSTQKPKPASHHLRAHHHVVAVPPLPAVHAASVLASAPRRARRPPGAAQGYAAHGRHASSTLAPRASPRTRDAPQLPTQSIRAAQQTIAAESPCQT